METGGSTHVLIGAELFESAVLIDERCAVLLPLGGQAHHPLSARLHQALGVQTHSKSNTSIFIYNTTRQWSSVVHCLSTAQFVCI